MIPLIYINICGPGSSSAHINCAKCPRPSAALIFDFWYSKAKGHVPLPWLMKAWWSHEPLWQQSREGAQSEGSPVLRRWLSWGTLRRCFCAQGEPILSSTSRVCSLLKTWALPEERPPEGEAVPSMLSAFPGFCLPSQALPWMRSVPTHSSSLQAPKPRTAFPCRAELPHAFLLVLIGKERRQVLGKARPKPQSHEGSLPLASLDRVRFPSSLCTESEADNVLQWGKHERSGSR